LLLYQVKYKNNESDIQISKNSYIISASFL
jgi:hypothetical protein